MDPDSAEANQARSRLTAEREGLEGLLRELDDSYRDDGGISPSGDAAADTTQADASFGVRNSLTHQLGEVAAALERVDEGTYGIDEVTGQPIEPARLEAEPTARTNVRS